MPNLRIIYDNAADRAVLTASSQASSSMSVANLHSDIKAEVLRSVGTTLVLEADWASPEVIAGVAFPFCNPTTASTARVRLYATKGGTLLHDTGSVVLCPARVSNLRGWTQQQLGVNSFAYGGGTYGRVWLPRQTGVRYMKVDIVDTGNPSGYLEFSRLVCGDYWSPLRNADRGVQLAPVDLSKHYRNGGGDLRTDIGTRHRKQSLDFSLLDPVDRDALWDILLGNGKGRPIFYSLYPNGQDAKLEQMHQMYCKLVDIPELQTPFFRKTASAVELEEV